jgi:hypothetical protein
MGSGSMSDCCRDTQLTRATAGPQSSSPGLELDLSRRLLWYLHGTWSTHDKRRRSLGGRQRAQGLVVQPKADPLRRGRSCLSVTRLAETAAHWGRSRSSKSGEQVHCAPDTCGRVQCACRLSPKPRSAPTRQGHVSIRGRNTHSPRNGDGWRIAPSFLCEPACERRNGLSTRVGLLGCR